MLQAQAVLNEAYCNKLHFQLAFQEEEKKNPGATGKLVKDGLSRLLSGDEFYEKVVEFMKWQKGKETQKETRQAEQEELKAANDEWKKNEAKRKAEKQEAWAVKQKFTKPMPKLGVLLKALPMPTLPAEEEENGEEIMLDGNNEESASSNNNLAPSEPMDTTGLLPSFDFNSDPIDAEELDEEDEYVGGEEVEEVVPHEDICIWMPSRLKLGRGKDLGLGHFVEEELQLWRGQANDSLAKL
ncbi:hypothetical protein PAXRUDRAFT_16915 [Paxillus rubicundulus Ve08.2h10]|uniref:Uncharacterized protein n=1 Tax=Paxillus rubicundulus Ve08.2h10 TaxID=930991 RepID=A0A0D0DCE9_9AGAM|nr:hypothetical protein PAXRUDRAFT_16915 [Paxillus rubicundulus Ve08.2h10]